MRRVDAIALKELAIAEIVADVKRRSGHVPVLAYAGRADPPRAAPRAAPARAARGGAPSLEVDRLAIGVVPSSDKHSFRLAVRLTAHAQASSPLLQRLRREAGRDIDVAMVGAISALPPHAQLAARRGVAGVAVSGVQATSAKGTAQRRRLRPLQSGASVAHKDVSAGTLGAFVRDQAKRLHVLSNNHVLAAVNHGKRGDAILQPSPHDRGDDVKDRVARLGRYVRLLRRGDGKNLVDAALAPLETGVDAIFTVGGRRLRGVRKRVLPDVRVWKVGRTTGLTRGRVSAVLLDEVEVGYSDGTVCVFDDQIEITGLRGAFSTFGDSGSLVVDEEDRALGLLFAGSELGGPAGSGRSYAAPIATVLQVLRVTLQRGSR